MGSLDCSGVLSAMDHMEVQDRVVQVGWDMADPVKLVAVDQRRNERDEGHEHVVPVDMGKD